MAIDTELRSSEELYAENQDLRLRLQEAEQAIEAIRSGGVDALVVSGDEEQIFTLEGAETPYRSFVEHMQEGAVSMSLDGTILYCNQRFAEIVGVPMERIVGCSFASFAANEAMVEPLLAEAHYGSSRGELILFKPGNCGVPAFAALKRITGEASDLCMVVTDLTDIVAARLLVGELEGRVDERTAALVAKNQELEGFTYSVSHDMRTPLRAIVGNANIVLEEEGGQLSETGKQGLQRLATAAIKMAQLVDDLLQYARMGVRELTFEKTELRQLAENVAVSVSSERQPFQLNFSTEEEIWVDCDPRILGLALNNLFDNACKYCKAGEGPVIEIGCETQFGETAYYVRDQGIGFDMAYVHKLFVPFERLHRDADYPGTGIGLANVRRAIERHGGRIWAKGALNKGATFYFTLPARELPQDTEGSSNPPCPDVA
jgi:signal transduction histidine kinase